MFPPRCWQWFSLTLGSIASLSLTGPLSDVADELLISSVAHFLGHGFGIIPVPGSFKTRLHDTMIFWKLIVRMQFHKRLNARGLAPRARFELATLRLTAVRSVFGCICIRL
jgi:hypothetical protein